ncbi:LITAF-like zinc ribbon domain protein (macronuclear) [Tetrahymena thermophila SB210]|uniref:LITAF-like zinc ribbon domain protein n=1 Tax=Tetrahymena thermophila (strain SB210) TaxID=312017 RepID=Q237G5_TETTS|nr:LITAF-like zinc ribbon domain protein [Tetrahymena thermophila SB210]EAR92776.1 LITAF-like zinc ribbon domain protein [Tetrahymena thermophila SB210]|eukprot:XP_001013021.1 LITAF-like zinc ribbon domain protein [Tetrahymena thermophila SB210]
MYQNSDQQNLYQQNQQANPAQNMMPHVQMVQNPQPNQPFMYQQQNFQLATVETCQNSPYPAQVTCIHCSQYITTQIQYKRGQGSYCCCLLMTLTVGCCILPLLLKKCKDKIHICPNCHKEIAVCEYKPCNKRNRRR